MSLDLVGIENVGEFYSNHYLDALLEDDLKGIFEEWKEAEKTGDSRRPWKDLHGLAEDWFDARANAAEEPDPVERWRIARSIHVPILEVLGYEYRPDIEPLRDEKSVPVLLSDTRDGNPWLWVIDAPLPHGEDTDPFDQEILSAQYPIQDESSTIRDDGRVSTRPVTEDGVQPRASARGDDRLAPQDGGFEFDHPPTWRDFLDRELFQLDHPPRWVLFMAGTDLFLVDRQKWGQGQYLRFDLGELFGRREAKVLKATCGLLHRDVLNPEESVPLLERIDENSHKHAYSVSTDLKDGARRAIELLANEAIHYKKHVSKEAIFSRDEELAEQLTRECMTYLYRLLFLFYVEARGGELGIVPMKSDAYRKGYSLETLRDLEMVPLKSENARTGHYISDSLDKLFEIVDRGFNTGGSRDLTEEGTLGESFAVDGLRSALFDESRTPFLRPVRFRNVVMQEVLRLLSLSSPEKGQDRGRISYAQLGINQLGAVYEGLLSYTGFFADETLYEVRAEGDMDNDDARTWFVPASEIDKYRDSEIVGGDDGEPKKHDRGNFIFRLAGRDREKSASYYTPEVLTECLTKYTLKERLGDWSERQKAEGKRQPDGDATRASARSQNEDGVQPRDSSRGDERGDSDRSSHHSEPLSADEILDLKICEPAMGSGAFLNEAVDQLAEAYLERKQDELGERIPSDDYRRELQKVKHYLAVNNAYGVDLNPMATELGKVSLWLNVLHEEARAPWFDLRLSVGNSLIGARRAVYHPTDLLADTGEDWLHKAPNLLSDTDGTSAPQADGLNPRPDETVYHFLLPANGMCPFDSDDVFCDLEPENTDRIGEWRKEFTASNLSELDVEQLQRLSTRVDELFDEHLASRQNVLQNTRQPHDIWGQPDPEETRWKTIDECEEWARELDRPDAPGRKLKLAMDYWSALWFWPVREADLLPTRDEFWMELSAILNGGSVDDLVDSSDRLQLVRRLADRYHFFHWELAYPEVFADRGGFDVVLGNPPWIKVEWKEEGVLNDLEPLSGVRDWTATQLREARKDILSSTPRIVEYLREGEERLAVQHFCSSQAGYSALQGMKVNTYKAFILRAWSVIGGAGVATLLHPDTIYDDLGGEALAHEFLRRLRAHYQFRNELNLFEDVQNQRKFSINIYGKIKTRVQFSQVNKLFHPRTLYDSLTHDGRGEVPGLKTDKGHWELRGHRDRVLTISEESIGVFRDLYASALDDDQTGTRVPRIYSKQILNVLKQFRRTEQRLGQNDSTFFATTFFDETAAQRSGYIESKVQYPETIDEMVWSGVHIGVANPMAATPKATVNSNRDNVDVNLSKVPNDYLPRTKFVPGDSGLSFAESGPAWHGKPVTNDYRHIHKEFIDPDGERTLIGAIIPPGAAHLHSLWGFSFKSPDQLAVVSGLLSSLPIDFFVKCAGARHLTLDLAKEIPIPVCDEVREFIKARVARLNCVTTHYTSLWENLYNEDWLHDGFTQNDQRLRSWSEGLSPKWQRQSAFRQRYERRQILLELDVLAAISLGLTIEELCSLYRIQFDVLHKYENWTYYDQRGEVVYSKRPNIGVVGLGEFRKIRGAETNDEMLAAAHDKHHDALRDFEPPFDKCNREEDMERAYKAFKNRSQRHSPDRRLNDEKAPIEIGMARDSVVEREFHAESVQAALRATLPEDEQLKVEEVEKDLAKERRRDVEEIIPYASDLSTLRYFLAAGTAATDPEEIVDAIDYGRRSWQRYIQLARWLELLEVSDDEFHLTERGVEFLNTDSPYEVVRSALERKPIVKKIRNASDWPAAERAVVEQVIEESGLVTGASVERRATDLHQLLYSTGLAAQQPLEFSDN